MDLIAQIEKDKDPSNYPFKNQDYLKSRKKINPKAVKNLKQLTTGIEGEGMIQNSYQYFDSGYSLKPRDKYCDFTGLQARYTDRKTGLQYHDFDFYKVVQQMNEGIKNDYLDIRDAVTILK